MNNLRAINIKPISVMVGKHFKEIENDRLLNLAMFDNKQLMEELFGFHIVFAGLSGKPWPPGKVIIDVVNEEKFIEFLLKYEI